MLIADKQKQLNTKKFLTMFGPDDPPAPVPVIPAPAPAVYTQAQVTEMLNKARSEEKAKLYSDKDSLKKELKEAQDAAAKREAELQALKANTLPVAEQVSAKLDLLTKSVEEERQARIRAETEARAHRLEQYKLQKVIEAQAAGVGVIPELISGSSEQEIDASFMVAKATYQNVTQDYIKQAQNAGWTFSKAAAQPTPPAPTVPVTPSPFQTPPGTGFPQPVNPQPAPQTQQIDTQTIAFLTSEESVRNGTFAKNRVYLQQLMRGQTPTVPLVTNTQLPQSQPPSPQRQQTQTQPAPVPPPVIPQPGGPQPLPSNAVSNLGDDAIQQMAAEIRARGAKVGGADATKAYQDRFQPTPAVNQ